jgi:hypothetical protein
MSEKACTDLMKAMGSPNGQWRPEPEKHTVARMNRSISEVDRAVAWALIGCTRPGHFCSFVLTEDYKAAGAADLQKAQGWASIKTAERVIREAEKLGYFRKASKKKGGGNSKIFLLANVETKRLKLDSQGGRGTCTGSQISDLEVFYSKGERKQLEAFEPDRRERAIALARAGAKYSRTAFADGISLLRWAISQQEYNAKLGLGFLLGPNNKPKPKSSLVADLRLEPVQVPIDQEPVQAPKVVPVQAPVSFMSLDKSLEVPAAAGVPTPVSSARPVAAAGKAPPPKAKTEDPEIALLTEGLQSVDTLASAESAKRLLDRCRAKAPDVQPAVSASEVLQVCAAMIERKGGLRSEAWGKIANPTGFFIQNAPEAFPGVLAQLRRIFTESQASTQPPPPAKAAPPAKDPPPPVDPEGQKFAAGLVDMLAGKTRGAS